MADNDDDDDAARRRARGSMENIPGIPKFHVHPMRAQELDSTPPQPYVVKRRAAVELPSLPPPEPIGTLVPAPWDDTTQTRLAAVRAGYRVAAPPAQGSSIAPYYEQPWWKSGKGFAMVLGALTAVITACGGIAIPIINAWKQPDAASERLRKLEEAEDVRQHAAAAAKEADESKAATLQKQLDEIRSSYRDLDLRYPAPKVDPKRRPKD